MLAARATTDPEAAELLEMFTKADATLRECSLERIGDLEVPKGLGQVASTLNGTRHRGSHFDAERQ